MLLSEGVENPGQQVALVGSGRVATILLSNQPWTFEDRVHLKNICSELEFNLLFLSREATPQAANFVALAGTRNLEEWQQLTTEGALDLSPVYDRSPFFFSSLHLRYSDPAPRKS